MEGSNSAPFLTAEKNKTGQELLTKDKQVPAFQHKWFREEILQEGKGSGQLGGQWVSGVETCEELRAQSSGLSAWLKPWRPLQTISHRVLSCWPSFSLSSNIQSFGL